MKKPWYTSVEVSKKTCKYSIKKALILEDEPMLVKLFQRMGLGFEMTFVGRVDDCLQKLKEETYDFVFLDYNLFVTEGTNKTGYDVCVSMYDVVKNKDTLKIIIHSKSTFTSKMRDVLIRKGFNPENVRIKELMSIIEFKEYCWSLCE